MNRGKSTCKVLKEVRREIARANGIPLEERECTHKGDCAGTCPYCEAEVRYLERELSKRKSLGKAVAVAGIALSAVTMAGCATSEPVNTTSDNSSKTSEEDVSWNEFEMGEVVRVRKHHLRGDKSDKKKTRKLQKCDTLQLRGIVPVPDPTKSDSVELVLPDNDFGKGSSEVVVGMVDEDFSLYKRQPIEEFVPKSIEGYEAASSRRNMALRPYGCGASCQSSTLTSGKRAWMRLKSASLWRLTDTFQAWCSCRCRSPRMRQTRSSEKRCAKHFCQCRAGIAPQSGENLFLL